MVCGGLCRAIVVAAGINGRPDATKPRWPGQPGRGRKGFQGAAEAVGSGVERSGRIGPCGGVVQAAAQTAAEAEGGAGAEQGEGAGSCR